jgi:hypothetical protein
MWNAFRSGTADVWYSGLKADLWVEYKWLELPKRASTEIDLDLSAQQLRWLRERYAEGRNVAVIAGYAVKHFKHGVVFENRSWERAFYASELIEVARPSKEIAQWLMYQCLNASSVPSVQPIADLGFSSKS